MMKRFIFCVAVIWTCGCGAKQPEPVEQPVEQAAEPEPQCLPGCQLDAKSNCSMTGNVVDGATVREEVIECPAICCDPNSDAQSKVDADVDGIVNDRDQCIEEAEDFDGFQDEDGCPEPDNDGDNILDVDDVCPLDAEDVDGFQDEDGCPD